MTVAMIRPLVFISKDFASSSMPKTTPASGALKAAATPGRGAGDDEARLAQGRHAPGGIHERGAHLHRRPLAPDRGPAEKPERPSG